MCPMFIYPNFQLLNLTSGLRLLVVVTNSLQLQWSGLFVMSTFLSYVVLVEYKGCHL